MATTPTTPTTTGTTTPTTPADEYLALIHRFPLRPIRDDEDYDAAVDVLEDLDLRRDAPGGLSADEAGYTEVLAMLIRAYDEPAGHLEPAAPLPERMRTLLDASAGALNQSRLAEIAGASRGNVADVLAGRRGWSKAQIARLAAHFRLDAAYFLD